MNTLNVGVIGAGHLGFHHARLYHAMEGVTLAGVADPDEGARARIQKEFDGIPVYTCAEDLFAAGVDAVSIVAPTGKHFALTLLALNAGIHVLVEKPMAATVAEAEAMVVAAEQASRILQVGHIERFNGAVMALFDAEMSPRFMECHRLSPFPGRGTDVSVVLDLMIHDLDIVLRLAGSEVVQVDAVGVPVFSVEEDIANVRLRFASGCVANLTSSRVSMEGMRKIRIFDPNAYVSTDYSAQEVVVYSKKGGALPSEGNPMEHIVITPLPVRKDEPLKLELEAFVSCIRTDTAPLVSGEDGLRVLKLAWRIIDAIREQL
ncbi:MAG: Gfo/Idh/MocA family oxidoreductase [Candidatus Hydrogenedentes bacterium]|nr:Gfo/Idh/MocA family oxidoreductase [Candidatus Hydrogenedentota bacterium]